MFYQEKNLFDRELKRIESRRLFLRKATIAAGGIAMTYSMSGLSRVAAWALSVPIVETAYGKVLRVRFHFNARGLRG